MANNEWVTVEENLEYRRGNWLIQLAMGDIEDEDYDPDHPFWVWDLMIYPEDEEDDRPEYQFVSHADGVCYGNDAKEMAQRCALAVLDILCPLD